MKTSNHNPPQYECGTFPFGEGTPVLDIRYDPVFKAVFTRDTDKSRGALSDLISALIGRTVIVEAIAANEPPTDYLGQKKIRYDISCTGKNGEPVNVEMSFNPINDELNRLEYFASRLFVGQEIQGVDKTYFNLKETYQISILARKCFFPDQNLTHTFEYYDPKAGISLDGKIRIITLELEKSAAVIDKPARQMSGAEAWAVYFQYLTNEAKREKIKEIIKCEEGIAMATNALYQITSDFDEYARLTTILKSELDWRASMADARNEGRNEAKLEDAKGMKTMGFLTEQIQAVTGLPTEIIAQL